MKNDKTSFSETQRFNHPVFLAAFGLLDLYVLSNWLNAFYNPQMPVEELQQQTIGFSILVAVNIFFLVLRLQTRIDEKGIWVKFYPFHFRFILYPWKEITEIDVIQYKPIRHYGGWGVRLGINGVKAFNTRGNKGIKFQMKDGRLRLIGTQMPVQASESIQAFIVKDLPAD